MADWKRFSSINIGSLRNETGSLNQLSVASSTPQWLIRCDALFSSSIEGFDDDSAPIERMETGVARRTTLDASGEFSGDGTVISQTIVIYMKYGSWGPLIQQYFYDGKNVNKISLIRFTNHEGTKVIVQQIDFETCKIASYEQADDVIRFTFNYQKITDESIYYNDAGEKQGSNVVLFESDTLKVGSSR
jgi:hypothetical protein